MEKYLFIAAMLLADFVECRSAAAQVDEPQQGIPIVTITAKQAGPPLWKVMRGDHTLWLFAEVPVVPQDLYWDSSRVANILSDSAVYVGMPRIKSGGIFAMLTGQTRTQGEFIGELQRLEPGVTLNDVVAADLYARLSESVPPEYLHELNQYRPWYVGLRLMDSWIKRDGFTNNGNVEENRELERLRRKYGVRELRSDLDIELAETEQHLQQQLPARNDLGTACLESALDVHENAEALKATLASWFAGESPVSAELDLLKVCYNEIPFLNHQKLEQSVGIWTENLDQALTAHKVSFAVMPVGFLHDDYGQPFRRWLEQQGVRIGQIQ